MKIALLGATGRLGRAVIAEAAARDYDVTALARTPEALADEPGVRVVAGDVVSGTGLHEVVAGCDVVVSALGVGTSREPTTVYSAGIANVVAAAAAQSLKRLVVVSAAPAGPWSQVGSFERRLVYPALERAFGNCYADMRTMEQVLIASAADWTVFRPPRLTDGAPGRPRISPDGPLKTAVWVTRRDLARAMLDSIANESLIGKFVAIAR
ncbi:NAD(P)-dependent oxidoreductase [Nocardia sp. NPDC055053]